MKKAREVGHNEAQVVASWLLCTPPTRSACSPTHLRNVSNDSRFRHLSRIISVICVFHPLHHRLCEMNRTGFLQRRRTDRKVNVVTPSINLGARLVGRDNDPAPCAVPVDRRAGARLYPNGTGPYRRGLQALAPSGWDPRQI